MSTPISSAAISKARPLAVWHLAHLPSDHPGRQAIGPALELVAGETAPLATSFFTVADGRISSSVAYSANHQPLQLVRELGSWKRTLAGIEPLAPRRIEWLPARLATPRDLESGRVVSSNGRLRHLYREIGAINDLRMLIRDDGRLIAGITVWRSFGAALWSASQLRSLDALQPLIERAYVAALHTAGGLETDLPAALTKRQAQVARLLAEGASNAEIARALHISANTAKSHTRAVLLALGFSSRSEVARRFSARGGVPPPAAAAERADELLSSLLDWAGERIAAAAGGCVLLSSRRQPDAEAWGAAAGFGEGADTQPAARLHRLIVEDRVLAPILREAERTDWAVAPLDAVVGAAAAPAQSLAGRLGLTTPLLTTLHVDGRVAGLIWLSRDARAGVPQAESVRLLRSVRALLQLALADPRTGSGGRSAEPFNLGDRGLSQRELAVARLVLAGKSNGAVAERLGISVATVKKHMTRIMAKCEVRTRSELIATVSRRRPLRRTTIG